MIFILSFAALNLRAEIVYIEKKVIGQELLEWKNQWIISKIDHLGNSIQVSKFHVQINTTNTCTCIVYFINQNSAPIFDNN